MKPTHKIVTFLILLAILIQVWFIYKEHNEIKTIYLGTSSHRDSLEIAQAISSEINEIYPKIRIELVTTQGSVESMKLLKSEKISLAIVQADIDASNNARLVSNLYYELFQILVHSDSKIYTISDLIGKRIAIAHSLSAQYKAFWSLMEH